MNDWQKNKSKVERKYGKWCSYNLIQKSGKYIISDLPEETDTTSILFFQKIADCAQDLSKKPLKDSYVLDLGCNEGLSSFVFADYGAKSVIGIEGREANITKAKFVKNSLKLNNVDFIKKDIRDFKYTKKFDIILALGILYHLDAPDVFNFIEKLHKLTNEVLIIDTHVAMVPKIKRYYKGQEYFGIVYKELEENISSESSIGNKFSFWLTRASLTNLLTSVGFTSIYEYKHPGETRTRGLDDRVTIIAIKTPRKKLKIFQVDKKIRYNKFKEHHPWIIWVDKVNRDAIEEASSNLVKQI